MDINETYERAYQLRCDGRYLEAKAELQNIFSIDPQNQQALHLLGMIQGFMGDFDESLATLTKVVQVNPGNADWRCDLAMTQMMLGMYEEACANLKEVLRINPNHQKANEQVIYC